MMDSGRHPHKRALPCKYCGNLYFPASLPFHEKSCLSIQLKSSPSNGKRKLDLPLSDSVAAVTATASSNHATSSFSFASSSSSLSSPFPYSFCDTSDEVDLSSINHNAGNEEGSLLKDSMQHKRDSQMELILKSESLLAERDSLLRRLAVIDHELKLIESELISINFDGDNQSPEKHAIDSSSKPNRHEISLEKSSFTASPSTQFTQSEKGFEGSMNTTIQASQETTQLDSFISAMNATQFQDIEQEEEKTERDGSNQMHKKASPEKRAAVVKAPPPALEQSESESGLVRCQYCERTFFPHRIEKHETVCMKNESRKSKAMKKQPINDDSSMLSSSTGILSTPTTQLSAAQEPGKGRKLDFDESYETSKVFNLTEQSQDSYHNDSFQVPQ